MKSGFTLIELLIVIAVLGTLLAVVVVSLNPLQRLAQSRDAGRMNTLSQLGRALDAYAVSNSGLYVTEGNTWITALVTAGDINAVPGAVTYSISGTSACTTNAQNGLCYDTTNGTTGGPVIIYARLESTSHNSRCTAPAVAWSVYASAQGRGGVFCKNGEPAITDTITFLP